MCVEVREEYDRRIRHKRKAEDIKQTAQECSNKNSLNCANNGSYRPLNRGGHSRTCTLFENEIWQHSS
jgi:hypothetical protein